MRELHTIALLVHAESAIQAGLQAGVEPRHVHKSALQLCDWVLCLFR